MKIFISHSSHDKWVAKQISNILENAGHTTFLDEKDIKTGDSIDKALRTHLKDSDELLILLTPASLKSQWVFIELGGAKVLDLPVIPILFHVGANEIPDALSPLLCRDINEFDVYLKELEDRVNHNAPPSTPAPVVQKISNPAILQNGSEVTIINVSTMTDKDREKLPIWVSEMDKFSGRKAKVTVSILGSDGDPYYRIDVDNGNFQWNKDWLIPI